MKVLVEVDFEEKSGLKERIIMICNEIDSKYPGKSMFRFKTSKLLGLSQLKLWQFYGEINHLEAKKFLIKKYGEIIIPRENVIHESPGAPSQRPDTTGI
jgi:hypothetical protein